MQDAIKHHTMAPEKICKVSPLYLIEVLATFFAFNNIPPELSQHRPSCVMAACATKKYSSHD